ncbi:MAG TPA: L-threonylcarbamoyladenylate synthase [Nitrospiraceae bacterium]|nr:L-threonylcarbamoyladenylate synthase [Nitrospiraceae bacterium]
MLTLQPDTPIADLDRIDRVVRRGGVVAIPTETFYGLGVSVSDEAAIRRVVAIKGRPDGKAILVLIAERADLTGLITGMTAASEVLINQCWPGPLTLIMSASPSVSPLLTGGTGTIGVRQPAHPALHRVLSHVGPLTGTSANRSGFPPCCTAQEVQSAFGSEVDLILDGGRTPGGMPSTIVNTVGGIHMVREGALERERILALLQNTGLSEF